MQSNKHLCSKDPTHSDDAEDIEDSRTHDCAHSHISFGDKYTCTEKTGWLTESMWRSMFKCVGNCFPKARCVRRCLPMTEVKSSGAELPAAMNVAPATSSLRWRRYNTFTHRQRERHQRWREKCAPNRTQAKIMTNLEFPEHCSHLSLVRKYKYLIKIF